MADRIIVVDDEREIADLIGLYLENDGYEVHKFLNGADALSFVEKCEPALAVLDVMLPDTDGFALLRKMREKHDFPIIMLTARVTDSDKILGLTIGADDYITKPFNPPRGHGARQDRSAPLPPGSGDQRRNGYPRPYDKPRFTPLLAVRARAFAHADGVRHSVVSVR